MSKKATPPESARRGEDGDGDDALSPMERFKALARRIATTPQKAVEAERAKHPPRKRKKR